MAYLSLHDRLRGPIAEALKRELKVKNIHALPRIEKVVVNVGINRGKTEGKDVQEYIVETLAKMTGQKPALRVSRKAISNFKIRKGLVVGAMVTLRGKKMEAFLDRLVSFVFPRIRDFRGLSSKGDGNGNYAVGLTDVSVFPEIPPPSDANRMFGCQIQIATTAKSDKETHVLLKEIGFPFKTERSTLQSS